MSEDILGGIVTSWFFIGLMLLFVGLLPNKIAEMVDKMDDNKLGHSWKQYIFLMFLSGPIGWVVLTGFAIYATFSFIWKSLE